MSDGESDVEENEKNPFSLKWLRLFFTNEISVAVGDGTVGKTCMCFADNKFPEDYVPTIFDSKSTEMEYEGKVYTLNLWDTAGQSDYDRLRPLSYENADIFILCYAVTSPTSLENISKKWAPEVRFYQKDATIMIVGTKSDLEHVVTEKDADYMKKTVEAEGFVVCSAKTQQNVKKVFEVAIGIVMKKRAVPVGGGKKCCNLM